MHIEIIEFYPQSFDQERGSLTGTLRIKLCDSGIHILGVYVCKRKDFWFFNLPGGMSIHHETGERVRYPYLVFEDREQHRELMEAIREKGRIFIEKRLADTEKPLTIPQKKQQQQKQAMEAQEVTSQPQPLTTTSKRQEPNHFAKAQDSQLKATPLIKNIDQFRDPPKRQLSKGTSKQYAKR